MFAHNEREQQTKHIKKIFKHFDFENINSLFCENRLTVWFNEDYPRFENFFQRGYFKTQLNTFLYGLATLPTKSEGINLTWITKLHALGVNQLKNEENQQSISNKIRMHPLILYF